MNEISPSLGPVGEGSTWQSLSKWTVKDLLCDVTHTCTLFRTVCTHTHATTPPPPTLRILHAPALRGILLPGNEEEGSGKAGAAAGEHWTTCSSFECLSTLLSLSLYPHHYHHHHQHSLHLTLFHSHHHQKQVWVWFLASCLSIHPLVFIVFSLYL